MSEKESNIHIERIMYIKYSTIKKSNAILKKINNKNQNKKHIYVLLGLIFGIRFSPPINLPPISEK